jgi:4-hydroxybenzoate polyprenyltransferase
MWGGFKTFYKRYLRSIDTLLATIITVIVALCLPLQIRDEFCTSFYYIGITVLAIVFSLFFASLAIIMSSSDNQFVKFLEEDGHYTSLMKGFKFTLLCLFISLGYAIIMYAYTDYFVKHISKDYTHSKHFFLFFVFSFVYSLTATALSVKDSIKFSHYRIMFINKPSDEEAK